MRHPGWPRACLLGGLGTFQEAPDDVSNCPLCGVGHPSFRHSMGCKLPMPTPMPIGSRSLSLCVGETVRIVVRRRSQAGQVGLGTLSGNAVGGVTRHEGSNSSRSGFLIQDKGFLVRLRPQHGSVAGPF